jgi:RNA polymerase sigma factor (sigma-70 family)
VEQLLAEAVQSLPQRCRKVLLLRKIQGLSQQEIAALLGTDEFTVEALVAQAIRMCADYVRRREMESVAVHEPR